MNKNSMKIKLFLAFFLTLPMLSAEPLRPFENLAKSLTQKLPHSKEPIRLGVGNFVYSNTPLMTPFSAILREELELALSQHPSIKVITRSNLAELEQECDFQTSSMVAPDTVVGSLSIAGVEGIVRGRYITDGDFITVYTEIAWLKGGEIVKGKFQCFLSDISCGKWTTEDTAKKKILPHNAEQSMKGIEELSSTGMLKKYRDFPIELHTADGERCYAENETISFRIRSPKACHAAVICHQSDGTSVVLFPNKWYSDTSIPANKWIEIPGPLKSGFEITISEPFGSDVVQVIACTDANKLHREINSLAADATESNPFIVMKRGMVVKKVQEAAEAAPSNALWSASHIIISTYPNK